METGLILKWINELQCEIDRLKKSGGGSKVEITPTQDSGNKVADVSIGGDIVSLFTGAVIPEMDTTTKTATLIDAGTFYIKCKYLTGTVSSASYADIKVGIPIGNIIGYFGEAEDMSTPSPHDRYAFPNSAKISSTLFNHPSDGTLIRCNTWNTGNNSPYKILVFYIENKPTNTTKKVRAKK